MGNNLTGSDDTDITSSYRTTEYPELGVIKAYESLRNNYMQLKLTKGD